MGANKKFLDKAKEIAGEIKKRNDFLIVFNYDADGITAGAIVATALQRIGKKFEVKVLKQLYREEIEKINGAAENFIFVDFGSGQLKELKEIIKENFFVLDHHQPVAENWNFHLNPLLFGIDGGSEISAAGVAYFFAKSIDKNNADLSALAVVGAVGDMQDFGGKLIGANQEILEDGKKAGSLSKKISLHLYGRISRPLTQFLRFASNPSIPNLTANEKNCLDFLNELGIELKENECWKSFEDLSKEEQEKLASALIVHMHKFGVPEWKIKSLIGEVYTLLKEDKKSPLRDAKEFGTLLNACVTPDSEIYLNGIPTKIENISRASIFSVNNQKIVKDKILKKHKILLPKDISVLEIKTNAGRTVKLTQNHELLSIFDGEISWISAEKLKERDYIAISKKLPEYSKNLVFDDFFEKKELIMPEKKIRLKNSRKLITKPQFDKNLGFLIGYIAGGGHVTQDYIDIAFSRKPRDLFSFKLIKQIFSQQFACKNPTISNKKNFFNVIWSSKTLSEFIQRVGIKKGNKTKSVCFDKRLLESDKKFVSGLLSGLFSSDGTVYRSGIEFSSHSKKLINQMVFLLQRFGLIAHVFSRKCYDCEGEKYRFVICGKTNIKKFVEEIGFSYNEINSFLMSIATKLNEIYSHESYLPVREKVMRLGELLFIPNKWSAHFTYYKRGKQPSKENTVKFIKFYEKQITECESAIKSKSIKLVLKSFRTSITKFSQNGNISREWISKIIKGKRPGKNAQKKIKRAFCHYPSVVLEAKKIICYLKKFTKSDLHWDKIKRINYIAKNTPKFVYDLSIERNHNYIVNGIVVHNCGRHEKSEIGLGVCMGDREESYSKALSLLAQHRRQLREGIELVKANGIEEKEWFYFFDAGTKIKDSIIGIVAGMLFGSGIIKQSKPIIAMVENNDGSLKASGRATGELVRKGLNLGKIFKEMQKDIEGSEGGGHKIAAGIKFSKKDKEKFLVLLGKKLKSQIG